MRKAFTLQLTAACLQLGALTHAASVKHPFVGEHANSNAVPHENGQTVSMRLGAKPAPYDKHRGHITRDGLFEPELGFFGQISEKLFGKKESEWEKKAKSFLHRSKQQQKFNLKQESGDVNGFPSILKNQNGFMWTGEIYMGKLTKMDVVYDTGSDWLVVEGSDCTSCEGNTYDISVSIDSGEAVALTEQSSTRSYGSAELEGKEYTDTVCILFTACIENFEFFLIEKQTGINEPIDGILGMSRNNPFHIQPGTANTTGPLYVEHLAKNGIIGDNIFSFYFTEPGTLSWVDLGEPDLSNIRENATLEVIQLIQEDFFWADYCQGVAIGDTGSSNVYSWEALPDYTTEQDQAFYSVIDTGSTALLISALYYESLVLKMMDKVSNVEWSFQDGLVFTPCDATYPNIYFMLNQYWIEVNPKDYLFPVTEDGTMCVFFIMPVQLPMNILGMPLFVDYYTIHDPVQGQVGWVPHTSSLKDSLVYGPIPPKDQFIAVGEAAQEQDGTALLISWGLTVLVVYVFLDYWGLYLRPQWQETLDSTAFIIQSAIFFAAVFLGAIYILQPILYEFIYGLSNPQTAQAAAPSVAKNIVSLRTIDHIIYGMAIGLVFGFVIKKLFISKKIVAEAKVEKKAKNNSSSADINQLLAEVDRRISERQATNSLE